MKVQGVGGGGGTKPGQGAESDPSCPPGLYSGNPTPPEGGMVGSRAEIGCTGRRGNAFLLKCAFFFLFFFFYLLSLYKWVFLFVCLLLP